MVLLLCTTVMPTSMAAEEVDDTVSAAIPLPEPLSTMLVESFLDEQAGRPDAQNDAVHVSWWPWSDETGSDWPDDDAKARIGQLGLNGEAMTVYNEQPEFSTAQSLQLDEPVLSLEGDIRLLVDDQGGVSLFLPVQFTPLVNLSDATVLSIYITEDRATDHHGRTAHHLVRDMMPQVGFSVEANNTTETTWTVPSTHLEAAGVDLDQQPHGWHITLAFFGGLEGENESRLLGLYTTPVPTSWDVTSAGDFFLPSFLLLLCLVVASGAVMGSFRREKGMPRIDAQWTSADPPLLQFRIRAGTQPVSLTACSCADPWAIRGGFKRANVAAGQHHEFSIRLKHSHHEDCHVSLSVEVEELGSWTQYLRLPSPHASMRSVEDDASEAKAGGDA
jgi:hypothetical protein